MNNPHSAALIIIVLVTLLALWLGMRARRGHDMSLEQWAVGGRSFGTFFVFLLMAGEVYTIFTFLGGSGWAYGKGAPASYIPAYMVCAFIISYWLLPPIWRLAKANRLVSQSHFFSFTYQSPALGVLVALVGVVALVPYLVLQLKGLSIIVAAASYGAIPSVATVWIGAIVMTVYVVVSGVRGCAWNSALKDLLVLCVVFFLGIYLPLHYYGGIGAMFHAIDAARPGFLVFPAKGLSVVWFQSTVLLTGLGFFMWPHTFGSALTARSDRIFCRNAMVQPLYQLILLFVLFAGFAAVLKVPGLQGAEIDMALLRLSLQTFSPWLIGVIGAAGVLTALVPGSMILTTASTLLANDIYRGVLNRHALDATVVRLARGFVPVVALVAVFFTLHGSDTVVALLLMGYNFVTQLFPALICTLWRNNRATKWGAMSGIIVGVAVVVWTTVTRTSTGQLFPFLPEPMKDLNIGFVALVLNALVLALVSAVTQASRRSAKSADSRD